MDFGPLPPAQFYPPKVWFSAVDVFSCCRPEDSFTLLLKLCAHFKSQSFFQMPQGLIPGHADSAFEKSSGMQMSIHQGFYKVQ